jgi:hypothetical protein
MADISRSDVATLIQDAYASDFLQWAAGTSAVLRAFPTRSLGTKITHEPVLATKPHAKWVQESASASTGVKPTGKVTWADKTLVAEELAVIVPVHEDVLADATTNVLADITKAGGERSRSRWTPRSSSVTTSRRRGRRQRCCRRPCRCRHEPPGVLHHPRGDDLAGKILQAAEALSDKYDPTTLLTRKGMKYRLANLRATTGEAIFQDNMSMNPDAMDSIYGLDIAYATGTVGDDAGGDVLVWDPAMAEALVVDRSRVIIGVRQDITVKFLDQATVGGINLAERDMVALRFKARFALRAGRQRRLRVRTW